MPAATLKLIAYGKVIDNDEKTAIDYGLKDGDFIVAMSQKAKPKPKVVEPPKPDPEPKETNPPANVAAPDNKPPENPPATNPPVA